LWSSGLEVEPVGDLRVDVDVEPDELVLTRWDLFERWVVVVRANVEDARLLQLLVVVHAQRFGVRLLALGGPGLIEADRRGLESISRTTCAKRCWVRASLGRMRARWTNCSK
jgi:hypothetical protein